MEDLSREEVDLLLDTAENILPVRERGSTKVSTLSGRTIVGRSVAGSHEAL